MKRLFILIGFVGVINVTAGFNTSAKLLSPKKEAHGTYNIDLLSTMKPSYTYLDGNLFLAIKTNKQLTVEDGDVVEFRFEKSNKLISFHVNEINQNLINTGDANLFVMIHNDLALKLKSHRLKQIIVNHDNEAYKLEVNSFWAPDQFMTNL
jgi:hypothetical protein